MSVSSISTHLGYNRGRPMDADPVQDATFNQTMVHPLLYEVNTRQWIAGLSKKYGRPLQLHQVPEPEIISLRDIGVTHLWLMGVWPTGPKSRAQAVLHADLRRAYDEALPGWSEDDIKGSPYAVQDFEVSQALGGDAGLAAFRKTLAVYGIKLILDFVPNHLGLDHAWITHRPHLFVGNSVPFEGSFPAQDSSDQRFIAHGKDPYFPSWTDTAQLEYRSAETHKAMAELILSLTQKCDGLRCDMAMLLLSDVFENTWRHVSFSGERAEGEFWQQAISQAKNRRPDFVFLAEAYWGLEGRLCELGFDYAYDKSLYDSIVHDQPQNIQPHLLGLGAENSRRAHFLENHDEPRVSTELPHDRHRAAAVLILGLPGMRFLHDGQLEGFRRFARVQLARRAEEPIAQDIQSIYSSLLPAFAQSFAGKSEGLLLSPKPAWDNNPTHTFFTIVQWFKPGSKTEFDLVVVNLASHHAQCRVALPAQKTSSKMWRLVDRIGSESWLRDPIDAATNGLYLDLPPWGAQLFHVTLVEKDTH